MSLSPTKVHRPRTQGELSQAMAFSPDGRLLARAEESGRVSLWHGANATVLGVLSDGRTAGPDGRSLSATAITFSHDGHTLAVGDPTGTVQLWDVPSRSMLGAPLPTSGDAVRTLAFSPDDQTLYADGVHTPRHAYHLAPDRLAADLCRRYGPLTRTQWRTHVGEVPYRDIC
ncbi:WD40 repeat domain-containing protein [Streptomyces sp. NPDC058739]|uniref:WD40 repeat domain-containing protein n=1 Tax=Streptomyces sp. NPDC058739 TaxID=3346618 RepID=UPI0036ACE195